ncbi:MAG: hypothetical protein KGQ66_04540 [Acidobacteriota bacterium]|nr:hypothetical protein [Acidobacteriota bacterium]
MRTAAVVAVVLGITPAAAGWKAAAASNSTTPPAFSATKTVERVHLDSTTGTTVVDDTRNVAVTVSQTSNLKDHQVIEVSWTGAHPTGGLIADQQAYNADLQEYPVVLMECRGTDSPGASNGQMVSPSTCWTATPNERVQSDSGVPLWALDYYADPSQKQNLVGQPTDLSQTACASAGGGSDAYWVPFVAADGTSYPVGPQGCAGEPPGMTQPSASVATDLLPSDTTYAASNLQGAGATKFSIATSTSNAELGCSETVPCTLEIIPIEGLSCDPGPALAVQPPNQYQINACEAGGIYPPGAVNSGGFNASLAVEGSLWYLASNWRNRIAVPLSFAPTVQVCSGLGTSAPLAIYGSELVDSATSQWNPYFCLSANGFNVNHVETAEPEAKNLLATGNINAAFQALPPATPFARPTVQAPVALGGFAIAYVIDNGDGTAYTSLNLDARLLAKLMTESYRGNAGIGQPDPNGNGDIGLANNPVSIVDDPEFKALNPGLKGVSDFLPSGERSDGMATLYSIIGQSDVIYALTSYINGDPDARAWLNGDADPWGMVVNPAYKGIALPVSSWQLLDSVTTGALYHGVAGLVSPCLSAPTYPPAVRPLLDGPVSSLAQVAFNLSYGISTADQPDNPESTSCTFVLTGTETDPLSGKQITAGITEWHRIGLENVGARFLIGLVPLGLASEYDLNTAALETYRSESAPTKPTDTTGRTFVAASDTSLKAAAALLTADPTVGSWTLPYSQFSTSSADSAAYPGTMLLSLDVPTTGLSAADAQSLSTYLTYVTGPGQTVGGGTGQLPAGYLPLTAANGLASEVAYSTAAAADIAAQNGQVPPVVATPPVSTTTTVATIPSVPSGAPPIGSGLSAPSGQSLSSLAVPVVTSGAPPAPRTTVKSTKPRTGSNPSGSETIALAGNDPSAVAGVGAAALPIALGVLVTGLVISGWSRRPKLRRVKS